MKQNNRGQVALIVLLIMAAALTLGLATSKKVVVDTKLDTDEEMLKKAFNAAESGVETYLGSGKTQYTATDKSSVANVQVQNIGGGSTLYSSGTVMANTSSIFWLVPHLADQSIDWANAFRGSYVVICVSNTFDRSFKVNYYYRTGTPDFGVDRFVFNYNNGSGLTISNGIQIYPPGAPGGECFDGNYRQGATIPLHDTPALLTVTPIFANTPLLVSNLEGFAFPLQGEQIVSVGVAGDVTQKAGAQRTVQVQHTYGTTNTLLQYMLEGLESGGGINNQ